MGFLGSVLEFGRSVMDAYTARKKAKGPDAAEEFEDEAQRAQKAQAARDVRYLDRALKRRRVLGTSPGREDKPPGGPRDAA